MSRWSTESARFALFKHKTDTTIRAALQQLHTMYHTTTTTSPTWPSWPATTAYWSTDQTIQVLLLWIKLIFAEIKEGWVFYLLTGPTLANIWIEHPLNKSLCPCQNRGLLQLPAADFTKNEILFELMLKIYIDTMNAEWCSSQFVIHEVGCGT